MKIPQSLVDEMIEHARSGRSERVLRPDRRHRRRSDLAPPRDEQGPPARCVTRSTRRNSFEIYKTILDAGEDIVGIYHSHTKTAAIPSQTDINLANGWPDPVYFIVSLENPDEPVRPGFPHQRQSVEDVDFQAV